MQEEAPRCTASCPLHVDVKGFCALMGQRRVDKAWQVLAKTLPLPGVLARLCDGPCKSDCVRKDAGGAIMMDALERFCVENAKPVGPPKPLPSRHKSVAVLGGSLTGLCAAWEMARRGFDVALYCSEAGAFLPDLPEGVLSNELDGLRTMGASVEEGSELSASLLDTLLEEKDAIFVDSDDMPESLLDFGEPDEVTLGTERTGLFASRIGEQSAVFQAAVGRRAANSIERFTQGVSMVSDRELEGPYETRLFTSLAEVESVPPVSCEGMYTEPEAREEAKRCLQCECMECVKACEYLKYYKFYPKVYARQIYNNASIVMGTRQANTMINSCMLCGLCETICPEDFSMANLCLDARRELVAEGHMPPSAHEFALRDMAFANGDKCSLAKHAPGTDASEYVFFPGCQLTASDPDGVESAYADLRSRLGNVGLMLHCCGAPAEWSGRVELAEEAMAELRSMWESMGGPKVIAACPTCLKTLRAALPDAEIVSHWSILRALGLPEGAGGKATTLAVNDPCSARHDIVLREDVRALLDQAGVSMVELEFSGELAQCCGYGGLLSEANPELGKLVAEKRAEGADEDFVTYCIMCRDMLARTGKRALHLYDLLYPKNQSSAARPSPGYSARRENRVRLRETLLRGLWREDACLEVDPFEDVEVTFSETASANMEERRILKSDVQKVLLRVRQGGQRFVHGETGHLLASYRPVVVTYWVEFEERNGGYFVHNTWSHRMHIKGERS